jgi:hypothetical protein
VILLWAILALIVVLLTAAALSDVYWRRKGFRTEIRGSGRHKVKVRVRLDESMPLPEDPNLVEQDWVRMRDLDEADPEDPGWTAPSR